MTFEQLRYLIAVHDSGSISSAAAGLHLSPAAVSKAISQLEKELGADLFIRSNLGVTATSTGEQVLKLAKRAIETEGKIYALCRSSSYPSPLKLAVNAQLSMDIISSILFSLRRDYPDIDIEVELASVSQVVELLQNQDIHLGLFHRVHGTKVRANSKLKYYNLATSRWCAVVSAHSPLAQRPFLTPEELTKYPVILSKDPALVHSMERLFSPCPLPRHILRTDDQSLIRDTLLHTNAFATNVELSFQLSPQSQDGALTCVPIQINGQFHELDFVCCAYAQHQLSTAEKRFISLLRRTIQTR